MMLIHEHLFSDLSSISIVLAMLGRFCVLLNYIAKMTFLTELYPTAVRNVGMSIGSGSSRIGGILAPYLGSLV